MAPNATVIDQVTAGNAPVAAFIVKFKTVSVPVAAVIASVPAVIMKLSAVLCQLQLSMCTTSTTITDSLQASERYRLEGNRLYADRRYEDAVKQYDMAIVLW